MYENACILSGVVSAQWMVAVAFCGIIIIAVSVCPWFSFSHVCYFYCSFIIFFIPCWFIPNWSLPHVGVGSLIQIICNLKGIKELNS